MTLHRILKGSIKQGDVWKQTGEDVDLSAAEVERLNKKGAKRVEPTTVAIAKAKAEAEKKKALEKAQKESEEEAELARLDAEEKAKKKPKEGGQ